MKQQDKKKQRRCRKCSQLFYTDSAGIQEHEKSHAQRRIEAPLITIAPAGTLYELDRIMKQQGKWR